MADEPPLRRNSPVRKHHLDPERVRHHWILIAAFCFVIGLLLGAGILQLQGPPEPVTRQAFSTATSGRLDIMSESNAMTINDRSSVNCCNCNSLLERKPYSCIGADGVCDLCERHCVDHCGHPPLN